MRCRDCRKLSKELDTPWQRIRLWFFFKVFKDESYDLGCDKFTEGFGQGYKVGFEDAILKRNQSDITKL